MVNLEIMQYIEQEILPRYNAFDSAHRIPHVIEVIRSSLKLAKKIGADEDMAYVIAAYHDLGMEGPRAVHHITSGKILLADSKLKKWFSPTQIKIMKEAVEDHRASASKSPRSIYGKIVAEADRQLDPITVITRTIQFGIDRYPELKTEEHYKRVVNHLQEKYSTAGYIKLWIPGSENEEKLKLLREIISNPGSLRKHFNKIWAELTKKNDTSRNSSQ